VPSAKANKPATLYWHSQLPIPRSALPSVLFALHAKTHAPTYTHPKPGTPTRTSRRTGNTAQTHTNSHKCTLARRTRGALTYETVRAATPWRREQRISATRASERRPSTRCKRRAKLRLDLAAGPAGYSKVEKSSMVVLTGRITPLGGHCMDSSLAGHPPGHAIARRHHRGRGGVHSVSYLSSGGFLSSSPICKHEHEQCLNWCTGDSAISRSARH
jgi:hypothetical protein